LLQIRDPIAAASGSKSGATFVVRGFPTGQRRFGTASRARPGVLTRSSPLQDSGH
ncbi:hypothetical protein Tco_0661628, partial [Tanacetum coccineum]